jgi:hypothetical protein
LLTKIGPDLGVQLVVPSRMSSRDWWIMLSMDCVGARVNERKDFAAGDGNNHRIHGSIKSNP